MTFRVFNKPFQDRYLRMPKVLSFICGLITGALLCAGLAAVWAATGPQKVQKSTSKIVLENDRVRVKEAVFAPGDTNAGMHTHDLPHVGVVIDGGTESIPAERPPVKVMTPPRGRSNDRPVNCRQNRRLNKVDGGAT
ncbi:MAG: hypothetical protein IPL01_19865 [Acidobacteria bacterium]|nr:hypothetical protein [Acidobacteriota bacterium]